ncbi:MAG: stalk domain-containing protein [Anaeromicrobium sp.]|jgi:LysM repeat protein|uniref:stalk domain-containing protein n=1 Tax=Anaeromicrobium sp. TaxID=1929132 RepID=UPI0025CE840D|nr:stalk domain-containing protein [Anaeromicrobium sp.]MCT4596091.1 stalk domain-containing protein [Anaeromicrobium sp.]
MNIFIGHKLELTKEGYSIILEINPSATLAEFASEFHYDKNENNESLYEAIHKYVKRNFSNLKIAKVKLVVGSLLLLSIPFASVTALGSNTIVQENINNLKRVNITLDNKIQNYDQDPVIINNRAYVPLGEFIKSAGGSIWWNGESKTVGINKDNLNFSFIMGATRARFNGKSIEMAPHYIIDGRVMVPVRFISEILGFNVGWDNKTRSVVLTRGTQGEAIETYTVEGGDSLWKIGNKFNAAVDEIKNINNLTSDRIEAGEKLLIPSDNIQPNAGIYYEETGPKVDTYRVAAGDTVYSVAKKLGTSPDKVLKYNYMDQEQYLNAGQTIYISTYAPRNYTISPGESLVPQRRGKVVDWFREGQYLLKRGDIFIITDVDTAMEFKVKMMGGYNHSDIEPLTAYDTTIMRYLFGTWTWKPRAVVVFKDGMNIAASLAGMPHAHDTIPNNNVIGHFDLYLSNSISHNTGMPSYRHQMMVYKAGK